MKNDKALKKSVRMTAIWILLLLLAMTGATYAWFTFSPFTNVVPMAGTIGEGGVNLLISNSPNGPFDISCELLLDSETEAIKPVSTDDLQTWYVPRGQDNDGIPKAYSDISQDYLKYMIHGTVYIKSEGSPCTVFLHKNTCDFGNDNQALAALRLGLIVRSAAGTSTFISSLDSMGNTASAESHRTVPTSGTVYSGSYVDDPSDDIERLFASGTDGDLVRGSQALLDLEADEVASIEFFLYLEGCDDNCFNPVQAKEVALQLGFAGFEVAR